MKRLLVVLLLAALLPAQVPVPEKPGDIRFAPQSYAPPSLANARHTLKNGMTVFIVEDPKLPVFDIHARVRAGGALEGKRAPMTSSMTADMLEQGGVRGLLPDSMNALLEFHAITLSASGSFNEADIEMSSLLEKADLTLDLFNRVLREPLFDAKRFEVIRKEALEDITNRFDDPKAVVGAAYRMAAFGKTRRAFLASAAEVKRLCREDLVAFHKKYYRPENIILGVSGRVQSVVLLAKLDSLFGNWKGADASVAYPDIPLVSAPGLYFIEKPINQAYVRMGLPLFKRPHPDYIPLALMNYVLGGAAFTSRIMKNVREKEGLAYSAYSSASGDYFYPFTFNVNLETKSASAAYAIDLVFREIKGIIDSGATAQELEDAKKSLVNAFPSNFDNGNQTVHSFTNNAFVRESDDYFDQYRARITGVTLDDVKRVARAWLIPEKFVIALTGSFDACGNGDGVHPVKLESFGTPVRFTEKELEKALTRK
ncbi:MAG: pitrilysin family protein [Fibrobacterota bacterium]